MEKSRKIRHLIEEAYTDLDNHKIDNPPQKKVKVFTQLGRETQQPLPKKKAVLKDLEKVHAHFKEDPETKNLASELEKLKDLVYGEKRKKKR